MALGNEHLPLHLIILHPVLACITVGCSLLCLIESTRLNLQSENTFPDYLIWQLSVGTLTLLEFLEKPLTICKDYSLLFTI